MGSCEFVTFISTLACAIAKDKTEDELTLLAAIFSQLRRYISNYCCIRKLEKRKIT